MMEKPYMPALAQRLKKFNQHRLPEMVKLKYEAMTENIFRFYRGTCHLFYENLRNAKKIPASPVTWVCGDLHLENYGSYKANNKLVYFDLNDFDEAVLAPALWEVLRLITSIFLAFDALDIDQDQAFNMATLFLKTYSATLCTGKPINIDPRTAKGIVCDFLNSADKNNYKDILEKRTEKKKHKVVLSLHDERHFKIHKPLKEALIEHMEHWIAESNESPYNYKVKDAVFRLAGTGSIGVKRYLFLLKSKIEKDNYLIIDMKQSFPSSLLPYTKAKQPEWTSESERIVMVQQRMQHMSSSMLSTTEFNGDSYVIQELQPVKDTIRFKLIKDRYRDIIQVIDDMAVLTASSQLRSGGMDGSAVIDELKAFGADKTWQEAALNYALETKKDIEKDFNTFKEDYQNGVFN
ncbi:DUF2252 domain-containing protein [Pedobacter duraquae]|uniref:Uncharacterized protein (DUF2252 family) n=1 Tax=Pedobacter duraquae TaxID=425511 RepID=A0A4R6IP75_9SPHI|nr:DUF2252 family protein [Pedobacter duraquae]TDO23941.1 uncharacterized protein (DUF2252 family) [Pedobacter duraquae]